jgi:hypothetical protein
MRSLDAINDDPNPVGRLDELCPRLNPTMLQRMLAESKQARFARTVSA